MPPRADQDKPRNAGFVRLTRRPARTASGQYAELPRAQHRLRPAPHPELVVDLLHIPFHRALGEPEALADLAVAQAPADHRQNVDLAAGEPAGEAEALAILLVLILLLAQRA